MKHSARWMYQSGDLAQPFARFFYFPFIEGLTFQPLHNLPFVCSGEETNATSNSGCCRNVQPQNIPRICFSSRTFHFFQQKVNCFLHFMKGTVTLLLRHSLTTLRVLQVVVKAMPGCRYLGASARDGTGFLRSVPQQVLWRLKPIFYSCFIALFIISSPTSLLSHPLIHCFVFSFTAALIHLRVLYLNPFLP